MARPREFEIDDAVEKALQVFWQHGYEEASLPDLLKGMGLTRGSLYKAFKDKKNLFLMVLDHYETEFVNAGFELLTNPGIPDGKDRILQIFKGLVAAASEGDHRGCLLCTAASGSAADDPEIAKAVHGGFAKLQQGFLQSVKDASDLTGLTESAQQRLADGLLTQYIGLRVLARSRLPMGVLEHAVEAVEDILNAAAR